MRSSPHGRDASSWSSTKLLTFSWNSRWRPPPSSIFKLTKFGTFRSVESVVRKLCTKFDSNIYYSHCDRRSYAPDVHLMTSRELIPGFDFWSRVISAWSDASYQIWSYWHFPEIQDGGRRHLWFIYSSLFIGRRHGITHEGLSMVRNPCKKNSSWWAKYTVSQNMHLTLFHLNITLANTVRFQ